MTCSICRHEQREAIEQAIVEGVPYRNIAKQHNVSIAALSRHKSNDLPTHLTQAQQAREAASASRLLSKILDLQAHAERIMRKAESADDFTAAVSAIREARQCTKLLAEVAGELAVEGTTHINIGQVQAVLMDALKPFPEARQAAARALLTESRQTESRQSDADSSE